MSHYDILAVTPWAPEAVIRAAYKAMSQKWHPDREGGSHEVMQAINEAWRVLSDPVTRTEYDAQLACGIIQLGPRPEPKPRPAPAPAAAPAPPADIPNWPFEINEDLLRPLKPRVPSMGRLHTGAVGGLALVFCVPVALVLFLDSAHTLWISVIRAFGG